MSESKASRKHENLFQSTDALLEEIESSIAASSIKISHRSGTSVDEMGIDSPGMLPPQRGRVMVRVSEDLMQCRVDIYPPDPGAERLDVEDIYRALAEHNVVYGIDRDAIDTAVMSANLDGKKFTELVVARGAKPRPEVPEHIEPAIDPSAPQEPEKATPDSGPNAKRDAEALKIDHRERTPFVFVSKGTVLALHKHAVSGDHGKTVTGTEITPPISKFTTYLIGENIEREGDSYVAAIDGDLSLRQRTLSVSPVLTIAGNVDYSTGNIDFAGDILLHGEVRDGFTVKADGAITSRVTLYATEVEAGAGIIIAGGIIGRNNGVVKAGDEIQTRFIENCRVECAASVLVKVGIMNSTVFCGGELRTGRNGILVGGTLVSAGTIRTAQIGSESGPQTVVRAGLNYMAMNQLEATTEKRGLIVERLRQLQGGKTRLKGDELSQLLQLEKRLLAAHETLSEQAERLVTELHVDENAEVLVSGTVYPGTTIEICHVSYRVTSELHSVVFRLNKATGAIRTDPLKRRG